LLNARDLRAAFARAQAVVEKPRDLALSEAAIIKVQTHCMSGFVYKTPLRMML
jgi:hypothetical protein